MMEPTISAVFGLQSVEEKRLGWNASRRRFRIEATGKGIPGAAARTMFLTRILTAAHVDRIKTVRLH
jgi:hypothetical protein